MIENYFPTPIFHQTADQIKLSVIQTEIKTMCEKLTFSKDETWVSNNHKLSDPTFRSNIIEEHNLVCFKSFIKKSVNTYLNACCGHAMEYEIIQSWMTKTVNGEITTVHNHGMFDIAGVYYYQTNGADGTIKFLNPNSALTASQSFIREYKVGIQPKQGLLILFPAWLNHTVEMNATNNERMSLAFNINIDRSGIYN